MTKGQKAAETRRKKQEAAMKELEYERKKVKRKRKPMTPEQKEAAIERLAKARAARGATGLKSVHHSLRDLPDDHWLHPLKVKEWIKDNEMKLKGMSSLKHSNNSKERGEYNDLFNYVKNMKNYLSSGHWSDFRYGANMESRVQRVCVAMAYYPDGTPKRSFGVWYPDIGQVWSKELEVIWYGENYQPNRVGTKELPDEEELFEDGGIDGDEDGDELY